MECDAVNHDNCHSILDPTSSPSETKRMKIEIELPHIEPQAFRVIQNYKRDNSLQMDLTYNEAFDVYAAYQTYKSIPQDLVNHCWKIVINNCNTEAQMCSGYNFAMASQSFKMLDFFLTKILNNISAFLKCDNFVTISTDTLITILQQICLNCTEIELFEACVHWCEKQPDYKRENLRKFMEPFLGHIRFLSMSPSEFMANKQIIDVLSDQELGAIVKKINGKECDDWPSTISTITSSRIRD
ncbi:hypothetical protein B566_EDAN004984 [Ephemera danica]|nr:hypothetical protein B566_EDAN004984 [Ephemera danica]